MNSCSEAGAADLSTSCYNLQSQGSQIICNCVYAPYTISSINIAIFSSDKNWSAQFKNISILTIPSLSRAVNTFLLQIIISIKNLLLRTQYFCWVLHFIPGREMGWSKVSWQNIFSCWIRVEPGNCELVSHHLMSQVTSDYCTHVHSTSSHVQQYMNHFQHWIFMLPLKLTVPLIWVNSTRETLSMPNIFHNC